MPASHHSAFTGRMPFLLPNQQHQSTEGRVITLFFQKIISIVCLLVSAMYISEGWGVGMSQIIYSNLRIAVRHLLVAFISFQRQRHATFRALEAVFVPRLVTHEHAQT